MGGVDATGSGIKAKSKECQEVKSPFPVVIRKWPEWSVSYLLEKSSLCFCKNHIFNLNLHMSNMNFNEFLMQPHARILDKFLNCRNVSQWATSPVSPAMSLSTMSRAVISQSRTKGFMRVWRWTFNMVRKTAQSEMNRYHVYSFWYDPTGDPAHKFPAPGPTRYHSTTGPGTTLSQVCHRLSGLGYWNLTTHLWHLYQP